MNEALQRLIEARHHDPFEVLGRHYDAQGMVWRSFLPWAREAWFQNGPALSRAHEAGLFEWRGPAEALPAHPVLCWRDDQGTEHAAADPYSFPPLLGELDLHLFAEGRHWQLWRVLGAHPHAVNGIAGVRFAVWAPNAVRISVVGDFNHWNGRCHPMRNRGSSGVWELFIPGLTAGAHYKYEILSREHALRLKADPFGQWFELRPATASRIPSASAHPWQDGAWMSRRAHHDWLHAPMAIYELHAGSWRRATDGGYAHWRDLARELPPYVRGLGFTHIELLPVMEHPFDGSWGYQTTGYFAPTSRHGEPDDFRAFVDACHQQGLGVILDWTPAHFPRDDHALAAFDGSALYEHADPQRGEHPDWGTLIFNYGRHEVRNFLLASALYWLEDMHVDGLRVDAVASMLYLDYSRQEGQWSPNVHGGRENLEAIAFLRELNVVAHARAPGARIIAEESTAWPQVTRPVDHGGLGFSMKWNMGWMHDSLSYFSHAPIHRAWHHQHLTFGQLYAYTENFVLPFSHDEVVHGKGSLLGRMPGDPWQQFANLRLLLAWQWFYPGKKLLFMGQEFAQGGEWNHDRALDWWLLDAAPHRGVQALVHDLNHHYATLPALHAHDFEPQGFEWIDCNDAEHSVLVFLRRAGAHCGVCVFNFTPVPRQGFRIGLPQPGAWRAALNTDAACYGGSDFPAITLAQSEDRPWMERPWSLGLNLPPLGALLLVPA